MPSSTLHVTHMLIAHSVIFICSPISFFNVLLLAFFLPLSLSTHVIFPVCHHPRYLAYPTPLFSYVSHVLPSSLSHAHAIWDERICMKKKKRRDMYFGRSPSIVISRSPSLVSMSLLQRQRDFSASFLYSRR